MKKKISGFKFLVIDRSVMPARTISQLYIDAEAEIGRHDKVQKVNILKINHIANGERFASDIKDLIRYANFRIYTDITEAVQIEAIKLFELQHV